jgi:hypothetical protein
MKESWKIAIAFLVVFLCGGAIGSVYSLRYAKMQIQAEQNQPFQQIPPGPPGQPGQPGPRGGRMGQSPVQPENFGVQLMNRWLRFNQLGLTPEQRQQIRPIVNETAESLRRLRQENLHSGELIIEKMQDQVTVILSPAQRAKFESLINQQRQRMQQFTRQQQFRAAQQQMQQGQMQQPPPGGMPPPQQQMRQGQMQPGQVPPGPGPSTP